MISYQVFKDDDDALIALDVSNSSQRGQLTLINGSDQLFAFLQVKLANKYDPFGHVFNPDDASAIDLNHALNALKKQEYLEIIIMQGEDLVSDYDPGLPENAIT